MAIYYISVDGSALNDGLSAENPWDLTGLNAASLSPGDQALLKKGDTFNGSLTISDSGSDGSSIVFGVYGTGDNPILSGFTEVGAWTDQGGNIWESTNAVSELATCKMVVIDGENTPSGRWPNLVPLPSNLTQSDGSWIYGSTFHDQYSLTNSQLEGRDWEGGTVVIRPRKYLFQKGVITDHTNGTLTYTPDTNFVPNEPSGFFITDHIDTLTDQDEWYYNTTTKKISVYSSSEPSSVKVAAIENIISIQGDYINISDISIEGANNDGVLIGEVSDISIRDCEIQYALDGIYSASGHLASDFTIRDNTISDCNNSAIVLKPSQAPLLGYDNSLVSGNIVTNCGLYAGMGVSEPEGYRGINVDYIENSLVKYNEVENVGQAGISFVFADTTTVAKNYINNYCLMLDDAGGIYTSSPCTWRIITDNLVFNGIGNVQGYNSEPEIVRYGYNQPFGIYLDDGTDDDNNYVLSNAVYKSYFGGIIWAKAHDSYIQRNLTHDCRIGIINQSEFIEAVDYAIEITGNTVFSPRSEVDPNNNIEGCLLFGNGSGDYSELIDMDNNYYCRPKNQDDAIYNAGFGGNFHGTIAEWNTFSDLDANSLAFDSDADANSTPQFIYNKSQLISENNITEALIEADGGKHYDNIYLKPFEAKVMLEDDSPESVPDTAIMHELVYYDLEADAETLSASIHTYLTNNRTDYNATSWGDPVLVNSKYRIKVPIDMINQIWDGVINIDYELRNAYYIKS